MVSICGILTRCQVWLLSWRNVIRFVRAELRVGRDRRATFINTAACRLCTRRVLISSRSLCKHFFFVEAQTDHEFVRRCKQSINESVKLVWNREINFRKASTSSSWNRQHSTILCSDRRISTAGASITVRRVQAESGTTCSTRRLELDRIDDELVRVPKIFRFPSLKRKVKLEMDQTERSLSISSMATNIGLSIVSGTTTSRSSVVP